MEDSHIIDLYWQRDEKAIQYTNLKYGPYCTAIAGNVLSDRQDVEECVSDTWLRAWNAMPPQRPNILSAFLGKITRNLALSLVRREGAQRRGGGQLPLMLEELGDCVSGRETVEEALNYQELTAAIDRFLAERPQRDRVLFVRRYWYGDSVADVGRRTGLRPAAVSMHLTRIRRDLKQYLTERGFDL